MLKLIAANVTPEVMAPILERADTDCPRCHGKGISGYKNSGYTMVVCKCVETIVKAEAEEELAKKKNGDTHEQADSR